MRSACLFAFVILVLSAAQTLAQSQTNKAAAPTANTSSGSAQDSRSDLIRIAPNPQTDLGVQTWKRDQTGVPVNPPGSRVRVFDPETGRTSEFDNLACYTIRSYRVVRDSPDSDSTHRDGYTTCVPSARFRYYTAVAHER